MVELSTCGPFVEVSINIYYIMKILISLQIAQELMPLGI
jgi:hypothetical protein